MDIIIPVIIFIMLFIACSVCGYCCKRNKQGIVYGIAAQPVTTTTTSTSYQTGSNPYPPNRMDVQVPMPQPVAAPPAGFAPHAAYPPTTPYHPSVSGPGYPPASGFPNTAPYPTAMPMPGAYTSPVPAYPANSAATQLPPSYAEATQNLTTTTTITEGYSQQSPYNPNYN